MLFQPKNRIKHETVLFQPKNLIDMKLCYCNLKMYLKFITANMVPYEFLYTVKSGRINLVIVPIYYGCYKVLKEYISLISDD